METLEISLPESMKAFIDSEVAAGRYSNVSDFILELVSQAQKRKAKERIELLLQEGLESPASEMTREDWEDLKRRVWKRHGQRSHP